MLRRVGLIGGILLVVAIVFTLPGVSQDSDSKLLGITQDLNPFAASAASDVLGNRWFAREPFAVSQVSGGTLFSGNGIPAGTSFHQRRAGLTTQVARIIVIGDPAVGGALAGNEQLYANAAANFTSYPIERRYAWGLAAVLGASGGFAIVPGGPAEALNRITSCLSGNLISNQGSVAGVNLDCSAEPIRRALADLLAPGFFVGFGGNPAVAASLTCAAMLANATSGSNPETRWAFAKAYVLKQCETATAIAGNGANFELRFAAVAPLAGSGGSGSLGEGKSIEERLANAWASGLSTAFSVDVNPLSCAATTSYADNLDVWAVARLFQPEGWASVPAYARLYLNNSGNCASIASAVAADATELRLTVVGSPISSGSLPLLSFVSSRQ
jgi:hypothetical protein